MKINNAPPVLSVALCVFGQHFMPETMKITTKFCSFYQIFIKMQNIRVEQSFRVESDFSSHRVRVFGF